MSMRSATGRRAGNGASGLRAVVVLVLLLVACLALGGCKVSERLTEVIYDQDAETIDYDNESKILIQDPDAEETTDQLPRVENDDTERDDQEEEDPAEDDEDTTDETADTPDVTAQISTTYTTVSGGSQNAGSGGSEGEGELSETGTGEEDEEAEGETEGGASEDDDAEGEDASGEVTGGEAGARSGNDQTYYSSDVGEYQEVPTQIDYVAAVGEAATIVSMLAGDSDALLYTDAEWAGRDNLQKVLGNRYNDEVQVAWTEDGDGYDLSDAGLQAMIDDERLECVFVVSGQKTLTDDQQEALEEEGIVVQYLPAMTTATEILETVQWIGRIFEAGTDQNTTAAKRADAYVEFHDEILEAAAEAADTSTTDNDGEPVTSESTQYYTLYVSDWADNVSYVGTSADLTMAYGVGICRLGYAWSPLSYYLSVAGVYNTSSSPRGKSSTGTALVWQFNTNQLTAYESDFSRSSLVSSYQAASGDTAYGWTYLCSSDFKGLGCEQFPLLIAANQEIAEDILADRELGEGDDDVNTLYELYGADGMTVNVAGLVTYTYVGLIGTDNSLCFSVAGTTGRQSPNSSNADVYDASANYDVVTNPEGLFGESWTGGSIESVLETAWASYLYYPDAYDDSSYVAQTIADFYATFYGYSLSSDELETILAGPED